MSNQQKIDFTKYIGYILFAATVIFWIFAGGKFYNRFEQIEKQMEETNQILFDQQVLNGKILQWMEDH